MPKVRESLAGLPWRRIIHRLKLGVNPRSKDASQLGRSLKEVLPPDVFLKIETLYRQVFETMESLLDLHVVATTDAQPGIDR